MDHKQIVERMKFLNCIDVYLDALIETHIRRYVYNRALLGNPFENAGKMIYVCLELLPQIKGIYKSPSLNETQCRYQLEWFMDQVHSVINHTLNMDQDYPDTILIIPGSIINPEQIEFIAAGYEIANRGHTRLVVQWDIAKQTYLADLREKLDNRNNDDRQWSNEEMEDAVMNAHKGYEGSGGYCG